MAVSDKELKDQLREAGKRLLSPPSSADELLPLLDGLGRFLERADQSPSTTMLDALSPSIKALVANKLLSHLDPDVKVSVANCISEITRITAPDAPYDDDQMKEIFKLVVSCFEKLHDKSSRSYHKRATILETVAKVRSCLLMLDLECDALILEMFQHFLNSLRDYHPALVFESMETIMTLVLEESEDISPELLFSILLYLKRNNEDVQPISEKLAEKVLVNCATKVKPYLVHTFKSRRISVNDYKEVVSNICQASGALELNNFSKQEAKDALEESDGTKIPSSSVKKINVQQPSSKKSGSKPMNVTSLSPDGYQPEESPSKKVGRRKKKEITIHEITPEDVASKKEDDSLGGLNATSTKQLHQKDESVGSQQGDKRKKGKGKSFLGKDLTKISYEDKAKECGSPPTSAAKSTKNKSPAISSKRKRTPSGEKVPQAKGYGENVVGSKIKVWWPHDQRFYEGSVDSFDHVKKKHKIVYTDGEVEDLNLKKEKWEFIKGDADSTKGDANDDGNQEVSPETPMKKAKTNPDALNNEDKSEQLVQKAVEDASSAQAKATASKRGRKKKGETNVNKKSDDDGSKNTGLVAEVEVVKSEESKGGKNPVDGIPKGDAKAKDSATETPLGSTKKTKQETSNNSKVEGKSSKGRGSKSSANGSVKGKAGSSTKGNQTRKGKKSSPESAKAGETSKGKSPSTQSKAQKSGTKSGRKGQRGS